MRSLISGSMRARRGVIAAAAVILAFGVWQLRHADVDSLPEFTPTVVEVQTERRRWSSSSPSRWSRTC
jgi:Cu/Ag efflux pump CusA